MKLSGRMQIYKRIMAFIFIILLTVLVEAGFNYQSFRYGYEEQDIGQHIEIENEKSGQNYVIQYKNPDGIYIKDLEVRGIFPFADEYEVEITERNSFGREEQYSITDAVHSLITEFHTNVNKNVVFMKITIPKRLGDELWTISISNEPEINKYRMTFFAVAFLLLYCVFFENALRKKPEYIFMLFSFCFGGLLLLYEQPCCNSWDEQVHFQNVYQLASGKTIEWNEAADLIRSGKAIKCNTKAEYAQMRAALNEKANVITTVEERSNFGISYFSFAYVPMAVFLKLGICMNLSFSNLILFGRLGNLLVYILVMFWAIRLAQRKKLFLMFISLMPTLLFLACSYTYDSVAFSFITLGGVLWANEMFLPKEKYKKWPVVASFLLIFMGGLVKLVYLPLMVVLLLMPQKKEIDRRKKRIAGAGVILIGIVLGVFVLVQWILPILKGEVLFADLRGGETSLTGQLISMLQHPWASIKMFARDILSLDNFRNSGNPIYNNFFVGNLLFLNYYLWGIMPDKWCLLLIPAILTMVLYSEKAEENQKLLGVKKRVYIGAVLAGVIILIWLSMYLAFTPVGSDQIAGVQARYYLPLLYFAVLLVQNKKVYIQIKSETVVKWTMVSGWVLQTVSMYEFVLKNRLF